MNNKLVALFALLGVTCAVNASSDYEIRVYSPGISAKNMEVTRATCKEIKENNPSASSGVYDIKPGSKVVKTYCNMDLDGGGWTLVQVRSNETTSFTVTNNLSKQDFVRYKAIGFDDQTWMDLRKISTQLMMYFNESGYAYLQMSKITTPDAKLCSPLSNTLNKVTLWHYEAIGCSMTGFDYSLMGYNDFNRKSATYSNYPAIYDKAVNVHDYLYSNGKIFVR